MAENPIRKDDLIEFDKIQKELKELIRMLEKLAKVLRTDLKASVDKLQPSIEKLNMSVKEDQEAMKKGAAQTEKLSADKKELIRIEKQLTQGKAKLKQATSANAREVLKDREALNKLNRETREQIKFAGSQAGSVNKLTARIKKLTAEYNKLGPKAARKARIEIDKLNRELREQKTTSTGLTNSLKSAGKQMLQFAGLTGGATVVVAKLNQLFTRAVELFGEFETGQKNVQSLLDEFDATLDDRTIDLMVKYGLSIEDTSKALFEAVSAGVSAAEATEFLGEAAQLAIAGVTSLETATKGIALIMNGYNLSVEEAGNISDALFTAQKKGVTTVAKLSEALGKAIPIAGGAGVAYQELLAVTAGLTKTLGSTDETMTAIRATINALINPGREATEQFAAMGIEVGVTAIKQNGLFETLQKVILSTEDNADAITTLIPNQRALTGILALTDEKLKEVANTYNLIINDTGEASSATRAYEDQMTSFNKQADVVNARLREHSITLGEKVAPATLVAKKGLLGYINVLKKELSFAFRVSGLKGHLNGLRMLINRNKEVEESVESVAEVIVETGETVIRKTREQLLAELKANIAREEARLAQDKRTKAATIQREKDSISERVRLQQEGEEESREIKIEGLKETNAAELELVKQQNIDIEAEENRHAEAIAEINQEIFEDKVNRIADAAAIGLQILGGAINSFANLTEAAKQRELSAAGDNADEREKIEIKFAKKQQALAIGQAIVNTGLAITEIWRKWAANPILAGILTGIATAKMAGEIAIIKNQKFAEGGSFEVGGKTHASGGTQIMPGVEAEKGEYVSIFSRKATTNYGTEMLEGITNSVNSGQFHEVWSNLNNQMSKTDPYTKKMYELMLNTPVMVSHKDKILKQYPGRIRMN